ncbi:hypothetical protein VTP01DRAFT_6006 [Rhizomucor pusillus]|uniref:uncharacterized protein n=1 Tax=Rhizomucor pusillus TaxID=4840 RepID=UPI00374324B5
MPDSRGSWRNLLAEEVQFNNMFGGFRSMIESAFGEIGHVFERFNNRNVIRRSCQTPNGLCRSEKLEPASHHTLWIQQGFDFGSPQDPAFGAVDTSVSLESLLDNADAIGNLQKEFLGLSISTNPSTGDVEYLVKWEGYPSSENTWCDITKFNETECIDDY